MFGNLDDLILVSQNVDSHLDKLAFVFQKYAEAGLKLNLSKCSFLKSSIAFLGHTVDKTGIHTNDAKIQAVQKFPVPSSVENVRFFLGLAGYYRSFIKNFASIASPLTQPLKKNLACHWHDVHQHSFDALKDTLTHILVLAFPDYGLPFTICTDASALGIGAVLMHQGDGPRPNVIAHASRTLSDAESRYSMTHLEALAVIWALKHFRDIIYGYSNTLYTDHSAVTQLFKGKNLSGRLARWFLTIEEFNPVMKYLPGKANLVADALSRNVPVAFVETIHNFSLQDLSVAQCSDPVWSAVIYVS